MSSRLTALDQAQGLRKNKTTPVKVIAVTAGKGGVGKSNVSLNLALSLCKRKQKVLLLDGDLGLANVDVMLGLNAKQNLSHFVQGQCELEDTILEGPHGLSIIPAASGVNKMTQLSLKEQAGVIEAFNSLTLDLDYMVVDTAAGISDDVLSFTRSSQEVIVVVCDEPTSLTDAYALIKVLSSKHQLRSFHVVANMCRHPKEGRLLFNKLNRVATHFLDVTLDYLGAISFDEFVYQAVKRQQALVDLYPNCIAAKEILKITDEILSWPKNSDMTGNTGFFLERLVASQLVD